MSLRVGSWRVEHAQRVERHRYKINGALPFCGPVIFDCEPVQRGNEFLKVPRSRWLSDAQLQRRLEGFLDSRPDIGTLQPPSAGPQGA